MRSSTPKSFDHILEQVLQINRMHWFFAAAALAALTWLHWRSPAWLAAMIVPLSVALSPVIFGSIYERIRRAPGDNSNKRTRLLNIFFIQVIIDLIINTTAIHFSGGPLSPIPLSFIIYIGVLAVFFPFPQLVLINSTAIVLYAGLMAVYQLGWLVPVNTRLYLSIDIPPIFTAGVEVAYILAMLLNGALVYLGAQQTQTAWKAADDQRNFLDQLSELPRIGLEHSSLSSLSATLAQLLHRMLGADDLMISIWDEELNPNNPKEIIHISATEHPSLASKDNLQLTRFVHQAGKPIIINDFNHTPYLRPSQNNNAGSAVCLPLNSYTNNRFLGSITLLYGAPRPFSSEEIGRAQQAADLAAVLISRTRLHEETVRRAELLEQLANQVTSLTSDLKSTTLLPAIVESARDLLNAQRAALFLYDRISGSLTGDVNVGLSESFLQMALSRLRPMLNVVVEENDAFILIPDVQQDSRTSPMQGLFQQEGFRAYAVFALPSPDGPIGALSLYWDQPHAISQDEISVARLFAVRAGAVLQNATLYAQVSEEALTDPLTELPNRRHLDRRLPEESKRAVRYNHSFALIMIDLDGFKGINDSFGHPIGDSVLQQMSLALRRALRASDFLSRYGGDEFAVILPETDHEQAVIVAEKLLNVMSTCRLHLPNETQRYLSGCLGVVMFPSDTESPETLIQMADQRLYRAKKKGRGSIIYTDGFQPDA